MRPFTIRIVPTAVLQPIILQGTANQIAVLLILVLLPFCPILATDNTTIVTGSFNRAQENGCIHVSAFYYRVDCSYDNSRKTINGQVVPWVGPTLNPIYYVPGSPQAFLPYVPKPGDPRIEPRIDGSITIEQGDAATTNDDTVSGTFLIGPAARSVVTRAGADTKLLRAIESWSGITHVLPPTRVSAATPNQIGGLDYIIGSKGFPQRICRKSDSHDCFPSAEASLTTDGRWGVDTWAAPGDLPIGRSPALGGNLGASTTAVMSDYTCIDNTDGVECTRGITMWGGAEDPGLDNLLLRISTDASGHVVNAVGFWTQEYRIGMGPPALQSPPDQDDSWLGGYLELKAVPAISP